MQQDNRNGAAKLTAEIAGIRTLRGLRQWAANATNRIASMRIPMKSPRHSERMSPGVPT